MEKRLHRVPEQAVFGGVAAGISQYFQIDVVIVRVILVVMLLLPIPPSFGWTGFIYLILWGVLPPGAALAQDESFSDKTGPLEFLRGKNKSDQTVMILGGALIFFGAYMLMDELPFWYEFRRYFWPIALIAIGAFLLLRLRDNKEANAGGFTDTTPPPAPEPTPAEPVAPDPVPYTPFSTEAEKPTTEEKDDLDGEDDIIKVN